MQAFSGVTYDDFMTFRMKFLNQNFIRAYFTGNLYEEKAKEMIGSFANH